MKTGLHYSLLRQGICQLQHPPSTTLPSPHNIQPIRPHLRPARYRLQALIANLHMPWWRKPPRRTQPGLQP